MWNKETATRIAISSLSALWYDQPYRNRQIFVELKYTIINIHFKARIPLNSCYISNTTSTPYDVLERVNREAAAQKDCELLCDSQSSVWLSNLSLKLWFECSGIAFKEGSDISCVLLSTAKLDKVCSAPTTILHKQTEGCAGAKLWYARLGIGTPGICSIPDKFREHVSHFR